MEDKIRAALNWAKENKYTINHAWYGINCDGIRALLLQNEKPDYLSFSSLNEAAKLLSVDSNWIRAFMYGFDGSQPHRRGKDGSCLELPADAYQMGRKLATEFGLPPVVLD